MNYNFDEMTLDELSRIHTYLHNAIDKKREQKKEALTEKLRNLIREIENEGFGIYCSGDYCDAQDVTVE